jgi:hypothetical protein
MGKSTGTIGVIHIQCRSRSGRPSEFTVSFGGDTIGILNLGEAIGFDSLSALLRNFAVPDPAIRVALQVLMAGLHHRIPNMRVTTAQMRELGLSD